MLYKDIAADIKARFNKWEKKAGVTTGEVKNILSELDHAIFLADKSDKTQTLFIAFKTSRYLNNWVWLCPTKEQIHFFSETLKPIYDSLDLNNSECRDLKGGNAQMPSLKDEAITQEAKPTVLNVADLPEVDVSLDLQTYEGTNMETGEQFTYKYFELNGNVYRVPGKVIGDLKVLLQENPNLKKIKVKKTGEGRATKYMVIPLS